MGHSPPPVPARRGGRIISRKSTRPPRDRKVELAEIAEYIRRHGVTTCPPGVAEGSTDLVYYAPPALEHDPDAV